MNKQFSKLLVCYDGSKYSDKALLKGISLAEKYNSKLYLIYVLEKSTIDFWDNSEYVGITSKSLESRKDNLRKKIKTKFDKYSKNIDYHLTILKGSPSIEIINFAKKNSINLIIVGNKGLGEFSKIFLGSISNKLVNQSPCSILVVK